MTKILAFLFAVALASAAQAAPPPGLDARIEGLRQSFGIPGVSIAIVEDGQPTLVRGYGVRTLGRPEPVDADTLFATGSTGKAFTTAALAVLVDQGRLEWDDKVIDHMPWFRMYDPWVTREMTIRDLLVHRSGLGLGAGDLLFVPRSDRSRRATVEALRHLKPATSFRSAYAYDNLLYIAAGQLIEEVTGQTWEDFVRVNILRAAGMNASTVDDASRLATANRAHPHARLNGPIRGMGEQTPIDETADQAPNAAPAGGLAVSARDMARWLAVQLGRGRLPGGTGRLFSEKASAEMWNPVTLVPIAPRPEPLKPTQPAFQAYALGWGVLDYRGTKIVTHSGAVFGSLTTVVLVPDRNIGFSIAVNSEDAEMIRGLMYELLDHYLGFSKGDWPEAFHAVQVAQLSAASAAVGAEAARRARAGPSLPLDRYAGDYSDPWYGPIAIRRREGKLRIDFPHVPGLRATLEHWQFDTFRTVFNDKAMEPAFVTFGIDADGKIERITMKAVSPLADFSFDYHDLLFTPVAAPRP